MEASRLFDFLTIQTGKNPTNSFLTSKVENIWNSFTFAEVQQISNKVSQLLINLDLKKGDTIAIISTTD